MRNLGFPTPIASKIGRVSAKTLERWNAQGLLTPSLGGGGAVGSIEPRMYSFLDLVAIRVLVALRDAGIKMRDLKRVVDYLREQKGRCATESLASTALFTDGYDVFELADSVQLSALRRPGQGILRRVPLDEIVTDLQREARAFSKAA